jgi:uncharacterized membrane protein (UPF0136 family)
MSGLTELALYEAYIYGALLVAGGFIGYKKAHSMPSLVLGSASGILAIILAFTGTHGHDLISLFLLSAESILLSAFFYTRFQKTNKFLPGGLMFVASIVSLAMFLVGILLA